MKTQILSFTTALAVLFSSCQSNYEELGQESFQQRVKNYHSSLELSSSSSNLKINKQKALMLALVDAGADYSVSGVWAIPVVGVYAGLWISFAASWAASAANRGMPPAIETKVSTSEIELSIASVSNFDNPYEELGKKHNLALNALGTTESSMLDENGNISDVTLNYMVSTPFMSTTQSERSDFISNNTNRSTIVSAFDTFGKVTTISDLNTQIRSNTNASQKEIDFVLAVNSYLSSNVNNVDGTWITTYIDGLEKIVSTDSSLTSKEKDDLLMYLSVLNYSYCFWEKQL